MGVESTNTQNTSFFKKVGNWFNKNGNSVGKGMQIAGTAAMGIGMTGMFIDAMNKPDSSIFGCGCSGMMNPMMMGMGGCSSFGGCCSPYSMMNPMLTNPMMMNPMMMGMNGSIFGCC